VVRLASGEIGVVSQRLDSGAARGIHCLRDPAGGVLRRQPCAALATMAAASPSP
jgi:hypothetical protein